MIGNILSLANSHQLLSYFVYIALQIFILIITELLYDFRVCLPANIVFAFLAHDVKFALQGYGIDHAPRQHHHKSP